MAETRLKTRREIFHRFSVSLEMTFIKLHLHFAHSYTTVFAIFFVKQWDDKYECRMLLLPIDSSGNAVVLRPLAVMKPTDVAQGLVVHSVL